MTLLEAHADEKNTIIIYFDGASRGNPGPAGAGWIILLDGEKRFEGNDFLGKKTNNQAEYYGLIKALKFVKNNRLANKNRTIKIYSDSQLIIRQLQGKYSVNSKNIKNLYKTVQKYLRDLKVDYELIWVPRSDNPGADRLANEAIDNKPEDFLLKSPTKHP